MTREEIKRKISELLAMDNPEIIFRDHLENTVILGNQESDVIDICRLIVLSDLRGTYSKACYDELSKDIDEITDTNHCL